MATYRNKSNETIIVGYGMHQAVGVEPDATFEVVDDAAEAYDRNPNVVRVDMKSDAPAEAAPAE